MSFHIERQTALLANGFRPALRKQLVRAIKELENSRHAPPAARIHCARKHMKKVRSALRLLDKTSFRDVGRTDHDLLRDASAELAVVRNAEANVGALRRLCGDSGSDNLRFARAFGLLDRQRNSVSQGAPHSMHRAVTLLKGSLSRIDAWDDAGIAWKEVARALKHFYKRGRAAFRKAADDPSTENLHRWRKRAKDLLHGLKLVKPANPKAARRLAKDLGKMCDLLGIDHDLAMLHETLEQAGIGREKAVLDKLIAARRRKAHCKALKIGAKFFVRKPGAFAGKIEG